MRAVLLALALLLPAGCLDLPAEPVLTLPASLEDGEGTAGERYLLAIDVLGYMGEGAALVLVGAVPACSVAMLTEDGHGLCVLDGQPAGDVVLVPVLDTEDATYTGEPVRLLMRRDE